MKPLSLCKGLLQRLLSRALRHHLANQMSISLFQELPQRKIVLVKFLD